MSQNIFQIWDSLGRKTPFAVRRWNWSDRYYTIVDGIECEEMPYGKAFGFPVRDGRYSDHYDTDLKWQKERLIPGCGNYQWTLVENADLSIQPDENLKSFLVPFGKYNGEPAEVLAADRSYVEWFLGQEGFKRKYPELYSYVSNLLTS